MESSPHGKVRLMTSTEPDLLQERLNIFLGELEVSAARNRGFVQRFCVLQVAGHFRVVRRRLRKSQFY